MYLYNTTFVVTPAIKDKFIAWAKDQYIATALESGIFYSPILSRILAEHEPGTVAYALQMRTKNTNEAISWHENAGDDMRKICSMKWGDSFLHFSTFMEIVG